MSALLRQFTFRMEPVIYLTRLDGSQLVVNADLIETVEHTADTVVTLVDGKRLVVTTPVEQIVEQVIAFRQRIARGPLKIVERDAPDPATGLDGVSPRPIRASARSALEV